MRRLKLAVAVVGLPLFAAGAVLGSSGTASSRAQPKRDGRIAFARQGVLYTIAPDGSGLQRVVIAPPIRNDDWNDGPAWSPDGKKLAFVAHYESGTLRLDALMIRHQNGRTRDLGDTGRGEAGVSWSPDGKRIVVGSGGDEPYLTLFPVAKGPSTVIRPPGTKYGTVDGFDPAWSPDGRWIAYRFSKGSLCSNGNCALALHGLALIRPNGSDLKELTALGGDPAWSPDGSKIAFTRLNSVGDISTEWYGGSERGISVIDRDGSHVIRLTTRRGDRDPSWSPSGAYITFTRGIDHPALWIMRSDGTDQHLLVTNGSKPNWQPIA